MKYAYRCPVCGKERDFHYPTGQAPDEISAADEDPSVHIHGFKRVYSLAGVVFKGPGFYTTDRRKYKDVDTRYVKPDV